MAILLNFVDFTAKKGSGKNAVDSAEALSDFCTPAQLNRFAEKFLGERFGKGTTKKDACEQLFTAMSKKLGTEKSAKKGKAGGKTTPAPTSKKKKEAYRKEYSLNKGNKLEELKGNIHAIIIIKAITALLKEKIKVANRDVIMTKAEELGLYEEKKSKQSTGAIFSWWRKTLTDEGWISVINPE